MQENAKNQIIANFKKHEGDTGSIEVQIALLTDRINKLNNHFKSNSKDYSSKRGLMLLVGRRRRFLSYIARHNPLKYKEILERLGLRK